MEKYVPAGRKAGPVLVQYTAELGAAVLCKHGLHGGAMVEQEGRLGAYELLDEERRWADFACRVLDDGLCGVGARVGSRKAGGSGELGEINGL